MKMTKMIIRYTVEKVLEVEEGIGLEDVKKILKNNDSEIKRVAFKHTNEENAPDITIGLFEDTGELWIQFNKK